MKREQRFLTTGEIARYCAVSHLTVTNWIRAGKLSASRTPGGHNRIRREDLLRFLIEHNFPVPRELAKEGKQILVVDDQRPLAEIMAHALQEDGYQVSVAFDGYEAGVKMATLQPDLLVIDLIMPGLDGFSICQRIKANSAGKRTKIIAMTGFVQEGNLAKAIDCGADLCLEKPFQLKTLKGMVAKLLGEARQQPSNALGVERRRSLRVPANFSVSCTSITGTPTAAIEALHGKTLNASREGLLLRLKTAVEPFALLTMQIRLRDGQLPVLVVGESRWVQAEPGGKSHRIGLAFTAVPAQLGERWAEAIYGASQEK
ncbi:MAG TPA: response regulator [Candidatus Tectomicrobia bacterium]|nr:response regulator [Candidatus Tectomicrobia bacterium]